MIESHTFHALEKGPRLTILGSVHGNEICGPIAIREMMTQIAKGVIRLKKGSVTFIPCCNPRAAELDRRFVEHNLNRCFGPKPQPQFYEDHLMNVLHPYLERTDFLLDIHSYTAGGPAFAICAADTREKGEEDFIASFGVDYMLYGWGQAYAKSGVAHDPILSVGTTEYSRRFGTIAATLECGQHRDPACVPVARRAIEGALVHCGLVNGDDGQLPSLMKKSRVDFVQFKQRDGHFVRPLKHLETVEANELLARYDDGEELRVAFAGRIIMPKDDTPIGAEWYYLAVDVT